MSTGDLILSSFFLAWLQDQVEVPMVGFHLQQTVPTQQRQQEQQQDQDRNILRLSKGVITRIFLAMKQKRD
jgi:hypothetical protein